MRTAGRRALAVALVASALVLAAPTGTASAHPLGNFTVNVYGGVIVRPDAAVVDYVVDMAEIPAFQERRVIDANRDDTVSDEEAAAYRTEMCRRLADGVVIAAAGRTVPLAAAAGAALSFPAGSGGLSTLRLECTFEAPLTAEGSTTGAAEGAAISLTYEDRNFAGRIGWREVAVFGDGATITSTDAATASVSDRLTSYPADGAPLDVRTAVIDARPGGPRLEPLPGQADAGVAADDPSAQNGGLLASLVGREDLGVLAVAAMLVVALAVGALHALGPGHGKTLIGAYLVGAGGTMRHAVGVGAAVSVMHTASVLGLGLLVLTAERVFAPERVYPWLGLASGLVALALGTTLLIHRLHAISVETSDHEHDPHGVHSPVHDHDHGPDPAGDHDHGHRHADASRVGDAPISRRGLTALAFSGGILPSPSALVVLLASVALGRTMLGLVLIVAFSLGLAGALIGVGLLAVRARDLAQRRFTERAARLLPVASAAAIALVGLVLTVRGAIQL